MQRRQLWEVMDQLRNARSQCIQYRAFATASYQGEETVYIVNAINQVNQQLYDLLSKCQALAEQFAWVERMNQDIS